MVAKCTSPAKARVTGPEPVAVGVGVGTTVGAGDAVVETEPAVAGGCEPRSRAGREGGQRQGGDDGDREPSPWPTPCPSHGRSLGR